METIKKGQKRSFNNTISAGLKSISGKGKTFYVIEFKTNTQLHRSNTSKEIIVDYIEIGRSPKCQIRFGEDCRLVSGVHCAIIREGEDYFIKHLSTTNPTLINGKPVADKWYVKSGDEVQLSYGGPILGFIVPSNNFTNSIPLTRRLGLFKDQALKPYKTAISGLAVALLLCITGFSIYAYRANNNMNILNEKNALSQMEIAKVKAQNDSSSKVISELGNRLKIVSNRPPRIVIKEQQSSSAPAPAQLRDMFPGVYYITATKVEIEIKGEKKEKAGNWSGTGFLLSDGRFITARHVIEPWFFISEDDDEILENLIASNGGIVITNFKAISASGDVLYFTSKDFNLGNAGDKYYKHKTDDGELLWKKATFEDDWASVLTQKKGLFSDGTTLVASLNAGDKLINLGFPYGLGVEKNSVEPIYSEFTVSRSGTPNGFISISGRSFDEGSSGGPVLFSTSSGYKVVGLVSAGRGAQGIILPISKVR